MEKEWIELNENTNKNIATFLEHISTFPNYELRKIERFLDHILNFSKYEFWKLERFYSIFHFQNVNFKNSNGF